MEKQIDVSVLSPSEGATFRRVRWLICDNGMTVAAGTAGYDPDTSACEWEEERPPTEYEGQVRLAIACAVRRAREYR